MIENLAGLGAVSRTISHAPEYGRPVVAAVATHATRADQSLLATADVIRRHGDRLALPPLSRAVMQLSEDHGAAPAMDVGAAASLARRLLSPLAVLTSLALQSRCFLPYGGRSPGEYWRAR